MKVKGIIDGIFLIVIGVLMLGFRAIDYFDIIMGGRAGTGNWHQPEPGIIQWGGGQDIHEIYTFSPVPTYIGIALIAWGLLKLGVELYGIKKRQ